MRRMMTRPRARALLVVAAVAAGGFVTGGHLAGAQESSTGDAPPDACTLVTKAEAEAVLGSSVVVNENPALCSFTVATRGEFRSLSVGPAPEPLTAENFATAMGDYAGSGNATLRTADAGDEAMATLGELVSQLVARRGETFVTVVLVNGSGSADERISQMAGLADRALARMP
ncbi:MAG TPA: hypothetical protein VM242_00865 [Acidimicrobiales bacterium]|nr:hypothetical protein [Acidimicrobiales bacterium]